MARTFSFLLDVGLPEMWVIDPRAKYIDAIKPMDDNAYLKVRGVAGVQWAGVNAPYQQQGFSHKIEM